jgi:hypothetical protein
MMYGSKLKLILARKC